MAETELAHDLKVALALVMELALLQRVLMKLSLTILRTIPKLPTMMLCLKIGYWYCLYCLLPFRAEFVQDLVPGEFDVCNHYLFLFV